MTQYSNLTPKKSNFTCAFPHLLIWFYKIQRRQEQLLLAMLQLEQWFTIGLRSHVSVNVGSLFKAQRDLVFPGSGKMWHRTQIFKAWEELSLPVLAGRFRVSLFCAQKLQAGRCWAWGHFGVLEHLTKCGISISAQVKARLSLFPLCRDAFAHTEEPGWPNPSSPQGRGSSGVCPHPGSHTASCDLAAVWGHVPLSTVGFTAQNHIQEGNSAPQLPACAPREEGRSLLHRNTSREF